MKSFFLMLFIFVTINRTPLFSSQHTFSSSFIFNINSYFILFVFFIAIIWYLNYFFFNKNIKKMNTINYIFFILFFTSFYVFCISLFNFNIFNITDNLFKPLTLLGFFFFETINKFFFFFENTNSYIYNNIVYKLIKYKNKLLNKSHDFILTIIVFLVIFCNSVVLSTTKTYHHNQSICIIKNTNLDCKCIKTLFFSIKNNLFFSVDIHNNLFVLYSSLDNCIGEIMYFINFGFSNLFFFIFFSKVIVYIKTKKYLNFLYLNKIKNVSISKFKKRKNPRLFFKKKLFDCLFNKLNYIYCSKTMLIEMKYYRFFFLKLRKLSKKRGFLSFVFVRCNHCFSKKSKNARMGKGKGKFLRYVSSQKKLKPIFGFLGISFLRFKNFYLYINKKSKNFFFIFFLLNFRLIGVCNFFFKFPNKKNAFIFGFKDFFLFLFFFKKSLNFTKNIKINFCIFKKNSTPIHLLKAAFKYKKIKHRLFQLKNKFIINISINNKTTLPIQLNNVKEILMSYKFFNISTTFLQTNKIKITMHLNANNRVFLI